MSFEDIKKSFEEMRDIESRMYDSYIKLMDCTENKEIKEILERIKNDEKKHENNVTEILKIIEE